MKFKVRAILIIRCIVAPIQTNESINNCIMSVYSIQRVRYLNKLYESSDLNHEFHTAVKWIVHYICNNENILEIRKEVILKIKICLNSNKISENQRNALILILDKIEKGNNLHIFTQFEFSYIFIYYYHIKNNLNSMNQTKINKENFEFILKLNTNINFLRLVFPYVSVLDSCNLIESINEKLKKLELINLSNLDLLQILKKCENFIKKPIELSLLKFSFTSKRYYDTLNLLRNLKIKSLSIIDCDFNTPVHSFFFRSIFNNLNIKDLSLRNIKLTKNDTLHIINSLKNNEMSLNSLYLSYIKIDEKVLCEFLDQIKNNQKLKMFSFCNFEITSKISKKISEVLNEHQNIKKFIFIPNLNNFYCINCNSKTIKINKNLININIDKNELNIKDLGVILNALSENIGSKIKSITFEEIKNLISLASIEEKAIFNDIVEKAKKKGIEIQIND